MSIDTSARVAKLSDKQEVEFDKALLATGANVRILHADGAELEGIHYLRTLRNADSIRDELDGCERIVLIGGGYICTELAASFTKLGKQCELFMLESVVHEPFAGPEVGRIVQDVLEEHGVKVHGNQELGRFEGSDGRVNKVITKAGLELECDMVVIGAGVHPELRVAEQAGLEVADGVVTDEFLQTSVPGIYAAGDIAEYESSIHRRRLRIEHWDVAFNQGRYAALNMLGFEQAYDVLPYFWSDLADWLSIEYVGPAKEWDEVWWRGDWGERKFTAFYIKDGTVVAALTVGRSEDLVSAGHLLIEGTDVSLKRAVIEDAGSDLSELH
jgi:3-phenylpropionate/trans-cinnamate dioxygenase ferredoxin reductase subunit